MTTTTIQGGLRLEMYKEQRCIAASTHRTLARAKAKMASFARDEADTAYLAYPEATFTFRRQGSEWREVLMVVGQRQANRKDGI